MPGTARRVRETQAPQSLTRRRRGPGIRLQRVHLERARARRRVRRGQDARGGNHVRIGGRDVTLGKLAHPLPPSDVASAVRFPLLRVTRVALRGGGAMWIPVERGPLARLDFVLAALPGGPPPAV